MNTIGNITKDNTDNLLKAFVHAKNMHLEKWLKYIKYRLYYLLQQHEGNKNYWTHIELTDLTFCYLTLEHHRQNMDQEKINKARSLSIPIQCGINDIRLIHKI